MRFAGERMKRIRLQKPATTRDAVGQPVTTWADAASDPRPWAKERDKRGDEGFESDRKTAGITRIFQIHARDDIDETWTVYDEAAGRRYDITAIFPIGARKLDIETTWTQGQYEE